jgi:hypothetical protein
LPRLPRLLEQALARQALAPPAELTLAILTERRRTNRLLVVIAVLLLAIAAGLVASVVLL